MERGKRSIPHAQNPAWLLPGVQELLKILPYAWLPLDLSPSFFIIYFPLLLEVSHGTSQLLLKATMNLPPPVLRADHQRTVCKVLQIALFAPVPSYPSIYQRIYTPF